LVLGLVLQACQTTGNLTPDQWNARTNAINAFTNSVNAYTASQRPVYGQPTQYRAPAQQNVFQTPYQAPQEQPLFGEGSLFNR
jgi:hypothetical protein